MARLKIGYLLLLFLVGLLPFAAHFLLHYPDERHYTDGAIYMVRDGGWLAPKTAEGTLRFRKPILAYWTAAAGYELGGINVLMSRLPFLLVGCLTLWLTFRFAQEFYRDSSVALLAALILLSHPQFILCSTRSLPDGLLCFSILLGAFGFLRLIVLGEKTAGAFWAAYGGVALAILSKGFLGIGLLAFAWGFAWSRTRKFSTVLELMHWPSMLTGAIFALGWFAAVMILYGHQVWDTFLDDQVTGNLGGAWWSPGYRMVLFILVVFVNFLPWSLTFLEALVRKRFAPMQSASERCLAAFILAWTAFLVFVFSLGTNVSTRYLLPAAPLFSIFLAWSFHRMTGDLVFSIKRWAKFFFVVFAAAVVVVILISAQLAGWKLTLLLTLVLLFLTSALALAAFRGWELTPAETLAVVIFLFFPLVSLPLQQLILPSKGEEIANHLQKFESAPNREFFFVGSPSDANEVHVCSGGNIQIVAKSGTELPPATAGSAVVFPESDLAAVVKKGYHPGVPVAEEIHPRSVGGFLRALFHGQLAKYRDQNMRHYFVAVSQ